ncbi:MAG: NRDE family protein, partial [Polyangiales bacterium]
MCTIVVLHHVHPRHPLIVAANRDEFYERPATPPHVLSEQPRVVGGLDRRAGGTWMGVTGGGLF